MEGVVASRKRLVDDRLALLEQVGDHELPAGRGGGGEQEAEELVGRGRPCELTPGLVALLPRLARLPHDGGGAGDQSGKRE